MNINDLIRKLESITGNSPIAVARRRLILQRIFELQQKENEEA